VYNKWCI